MWNSGSFSFERLHALAARGQSAVAVRLSSLLRAKREPEMILAPLARGRFFFWSNGFALRAGQRQSWFFL